MRKWRHFYNRENWNPVIFEVAWWPLKAERGTLCIWKSLSEPSSFHSGTKHCWLWTHILQNDFTMFITLVLSHCPVSGNINFAYRSVTSFSCLCKNNMNLINVWCGSRSTSCVSHWRLWCREKLENVVFILTVLLFMCVFHIEVWMIWTAVIFHTFCYFRGVLSNLYNLQTQAARQFASEESDPIIVVAMMVACLRRVDLMWTQCVSKLQQIQQCTFSDH